MFNFLNVREKNDFLNSTEFKLGVCTKILLESKNIDTKIIQKYYDGIIFGNVSIYEDFGANPPVACVLWANITERVLSRIERTKNTYLHPTEWNEGDICFVIHVAAPYGHFKFVKKEFTAIHPKIFYFNKSIRYYTS